MDQEHYPEETLATQAMLDLSDANLSPATHEADWATEIARLRRDSAQGEGGTDTDFTHVIEESSLMA